MPALAFVIPVLDDAPALDAAGPALRALRDAGHRVVVADGGSADASRSVAEQVADRVVEAPRGRARQMNAGAAAAGGDVLAFLHADTALPPGAPEVILGALDADRVAWGRFDVALSGAAPAYRVIERMINLRSRLTGIATGDQCIFVRRAVFEAIGGFPDLPLMEDVAISRVLRRASWPACPRERVVTSSRRWEQHGIARTVVTMWGLRAAYALGVPPSRLARKYNRPAR